MKPKGKAKIAADTIILLCCITLLCSTFFWKEKKEWAPVFAVILLLGAAGTAADIRAQSRKKGERHGSVPSDEMAIWRLILLDEQNKPVKSWDLSGKTSVILGKRNEEEEVEVDLSDCAYSAFIEPLHAALNFCRNSWYVEDLGSANGIKIGKVEDGACYKVFNRPCRVTSGDIIYIANTRLLLT